MTNDENFFAQKEARDSASDCDNCKLKECALAKIENMVYEAEKRHK
jgi:hypothetical protein